MKATDEINAPAGDHDITVQAFEEITRLRPRPHCDQFRSLLIIIN
jgi:hypothetical protein